MPNKKFRMGMLVMALVFVMTVVGCSIGSIGGGRFTLTDIPSKYNGKYAALAGTNLSDIKIAYVGYQSVNGKDKNKLCRISDGRVSLPMWTVDRSTKIEKYSGSDTLNMVTVSIYDSETKAKENPGVPVASNVFMSVAFSKGSATKSWKSGMPKEAGDTILDQILKLVR